MAELMFEKIVQEEIDGIPVLLGVTEVGKLIGGWDRRKVHTYWKRGIMPDPAAYIGKRPVWTEKQIQTWIAQRGSEYK
jgi:hypothetical protein